MAVLNGTVPQPVGNTDRGIFGQWLTPHRIAREDWQRNEQSAMLAFQRESEFNAAEAQKNRDWQTQMSNTEIQRRVEDLKKAGLNPVLAVTQGGASTPSGSTASAKSSAGNNGSGYQGTLPQFVGTIAQIVAGMYTAGANNAVKLAIANKDEVSTVFDKYGELVHSIVKSKK